MNLGHQLLRCEVFQSGDECLIGAPHSTLIGLEYRFCCALVLVASVVVALDAGFVGTSIGSAR